MRPPIAVAKALFRPQFPDQQGVYQSNERTDNFRLARHSSTKLKNRFSRNKWSLK
jgi:hypothetical protein